MILQSLHALYDRLAEDPAYRVPARGYSLQKITFKVVLTPDGELFEIQDARIPSSSGPIPRQLIVPGGDKPTGRVTPKSVHGKVRLLRNDLPFLLGARIEEVDQPETGTKTKVLTPASLEFDAFRQFHLSLEADIDDDAFKAACRFLRGWDIDMINEHNEVLAFGTGQGVFQIQGETSFIHQKPAVIGGKHRWAARRERMSTVHNVS